VVNTVFEFKEASVSYEASGSAGTVNIYTDMPSWGSRQTVSLPVTTGGKTPVVTALNFSGIHYRVGFTAGGGTSDVLKPYEMSLKVKRIGLYLKAGDSWQTGDIAVSI
jgi:hypothetical protein